ncbi:MAG: hypothetical protein MK212_13500 [Saprospiraceae bacterium]|nr:hypothetical protein [Saprospiraceae bacterium]
MRRNYTDEANKLTKAIDIAIEAHQKYQPDDLTKVQVDQAIAAYKQYKEMALNPAPQFKKIASLKYLIEAVFTYFQEASGKTVEYFWKRIQEENLDYKRENKLLKILKRGKIKGRIEYEYVVDIIVIAEQEKRISTEEVKQLNQMIADFESKY